ncbi:hypothetical protein HNO88_000288 [Novosphingobium chloroacetimidivorans]|uniref:Uncharacterized protein n=1 Tax=Novosphingobium chloroacetimidivorans TaxID=1428314 RepID=A0A7W7K6C4_9SPHN|nr:hypothetical protein [Novosphingobium chloroacetimidivorans]MBB4856991.1 hypothetical protein [Novosphingobium chloroacetimidivorans]
MTDSNKAQHNLAERLAEVVRKLERAGELQEIARRVDQEVRDLRRWASGTTLPGHVLVALLDELPRHHADYLIGNTRLRLTCKDTSETATAFRAAAATSSFVAEVAERMSDGEWCHRDEAVAKEKARETITELQHFVGE